MFYIVYNSKYVENVVFLSTMTTSLQKKNVVVNHNKFLKFFIDFSFSLLVKFIEIKFYVIQ